MKTVLAVAAILGLSTSFAFADCAWHNKSASADVDRTITTASVKTTTKQSRLPATTDELVLKEDKDLPAAE